jgi:hypothetical protein
MEVSLYPLAEDVIVQDAALDDIGQCQVNPVPHKARASADERRVSNHGIQQVSELGGDLHIDLAGSSHIPSLRLQLAISNLEFSIAT